MKKKILVVDDEKNVTSFLKVCLEDAGYDVRAENSGEAGLDAVKVYKPDLILLDIMMKELGGDALANKIKNDPQMHNTPIVFLTGIVTKEEVAANDGFIGGYPYLAKPILAIRELLDCIRENIR